MRVPTVFRFIASIALIAASYVESGFWFVSSEVLANQENGSQVARKFREYNPAIYGETKEPLDYFYNELLTLPNAQAYIIYYRGKHRAAAQDHVYAKRYLDNRGGIPPGRIKAIYGGYRQDTAVALWIVPEGAAAPKPTPTYFPKRRIKH